MVGMHENKQIQTNNTSGTGGQNRDEGNRPQPAAGMGCAGAIADSHMLLHARWSPKHRGENFNYVGCVTREEITCDLLRKH